MAALWAGGHKGFLWSSLPYYQDPAGTAVASWGDPVGLISDDSGNGADFTQATVTARPVLGRVPVGGRRNLLRWSQDTNSGWTKLNSATSVISDTLAPDGTSFFSECTVGPERSDQIFQASVPSPAMSRVEPSFWLANPNMSTGALRVHRAGGGGTDGTGLWLVDLGLISGPTRITRDHPAVTVAVEFVSSSEGTTGIVLYPELAGTLLSFQLWGAQLEAGELTTPYQSVTTDYDITETGIPDVYYLHFDGVDDSVSTTLPAISNGTVVIAGTNGIWIDDDFNHTGGAFTVGPTTYTGGPVGILPIVGDLIVGGSFAIDRQLTVQERARVISKLKSMGAGEVLA